MTPPPADASHAASPVAIHGPTWARGAFLTARWSNLLLISYHVEPRLLEPLLPAGCELDLFESKPAVSLVAFDFLDTRVKGVRWPGYVSFPEINLRYYVCQKPRSEGGGANAGTHVRRGVSFVRELVPKRAIAWSAKLLYNEPYGACRMRSRIEDQTELVDGRQTSVMSMRHDFCLGGKRYVIEATADKAATRPPHDSPEHWFKEHQWGFGRDRRGRALVYEVRHEHWDVHAVRSVTLDVDFGAVYGREWAFLRNATPMSRVWAKGSAIAVFPHGRV